MDLYFKHFHLHPVEIQKRQQYIYKRRFPLQMIAPKLSFSQDITFKLFTEDLKRQDFQTKERKRVILPSKNQIKSFFDSV